MRCLASMAVLSQALCATHLPALQACLQPAPPRQQQQGQQEGEGSGRGALAEGPARSEAVRVAAVEALAAIVDAFPSTFGGRLALVGRLVTGEGELHVGLGHTKAAM